MGDKEGPWWECMRQGTFRREKVGSNPRAAKRPEKEDIYIDIDDSLEGKHKGGDEGTFGVEGGVQKSTQTRLR